MRGDKTSPNYNKPLGTDINLRNQMHGDTEGLGLNIDMIIERIKTIVVTTYDGGDLHTTTCEDYRITRGS